MQNLASPTAIKNCLQEYGLHPKKRFGQNFLSDKNILIKIAEACEIEESDLILEIGPGLGVLTIELAQRATKVLTVDIDTDFLPILKKNLIEFDNVSSIYKDILEIDIEEEIEKAFLLEQELPYKVCANIPYNITSPIIFKLLEQCPNMKFAMLMMQKEVAERLLAQTGTKDYGLLTIMTKYYADVKKVLSVSRNCFYPKPDVDSIIVRITPHIEKVYIKDEQVFKNLCRAAFQKRRKTILNIVSDYFGIEKQRAGNILSNIGIVNELRPENLELEDFAKLANEFS